MRSRFSMHFCIANCHPQLLHGYPNRQSFASETSQSVAKHKLSSFRRPSITASPIRIMDSLNYLRFVALLPQLVHIYTSQCANLIIKLANKHTL